jgi:potassium-transporting ATPase KdpC subunit
VNRDLPNTGGLAGRALKAATQQLWPAVVGLVALTALTGGLFPLVLLGVSHVAFPQQAGGGLVVDRQGVRGALLIGQPFASPGYFHPRPSAAGAGYDGLASGGSNLAPANPKLAATLRQATAAYRRDNGLAPDAPIPADAVTSSGSGLDPDISPQDAALQAPRVARARHLSEHQVQDLLRRHAVGPQFGVLGAPRVPVLPLNLALDRLTRSAGP